MTTCHSCHSIKQSPSQIKHHDYLCKAGNLFHQYSCSPKLAKESQNFMLPHGDDVSMSFGGVMFIKTIGEQ